jgi:two-component system, NtrC family, sensor kinase
MSNLIHWTVRRTSFFLFVACFVFSGLFSSAQIFEDKGYWTELMRYNILPIDSLWLFHPGNDKPVSMKDSGWELANTKLLTDEKGQPLPGMGFGWYQKTFEVPPAFRSKPAEFRMGQFGASEIFLDGKLIQRYGEVANSIQDEKIFVPRVPVSFILDSQSTHTVLVHYSNMHASLPGYNDKHIGFRLLIAPTDVFPQEESSKISTLPISASIMFLFGVFFLFVYFFYPKRLASLITTILLLNFCAMFVGIYYSITESEWETLRKIAVFVQIESVWSILLQLLVLYALYYRDKMPRRFYLIIAAMVIAVIAAFYPKIGILLIPILIFVYFDMYRLLILGIKNKKSGFWILLVGSVIQQAGFFIIVQDIFHWFPVLTTRGLVMQLIFPQLGVPLTYALQFAWEFGTANRDLRMQLAQVKTLSETTLQQEQEKQEILTQQKEKLEIMVTDRTSELSHQKEALQNTLENLKSTQTLLIQSEKMASLGELTAGIAHEIQNPLNFINNFSEVNKELIEELKVESLKPKAERDYQLEEEILNNLIKNEEKINHHGQRADAIVKGMLQHSRTSAGQKEATDINVLADEYLRLAYHGLRAKDKSFNATLKTDFDQGVGKINFVPQDIGRVLLNLYNNAFYAVREKKKQQTEKYEPTISVTTKGSGDKISISVKDNGNGIPQKVLDKIFQPFFTTKPAGEGTGLGLSLSYDIVKAHGGEIKVATKEGEYTEFTVQIPTA